MAIFVYLCNIGPDEDFQMNLKKLSIAVVSHT